MRTVIVPFKVDGNVIDPLQIIDREHGIRWVYVFYKALSRAEVIAQFPGFEIAPPS